MGGRDRAARGVHVPAIVAIVYAGALAAGIANVFVFNAIRLVGPTRVTAIAVPRAGGRRDPRRAVPRRAGRARRRSWAAPIIVLGVWLTRRPSVLPASRGSAVPGRSRELPAARPAATAPRAAGAGAATAGRAAPPIAFLVDYDGTIAQTDV